MKSVVKLVLTSFGLILLLMALASVVFSGQVIELLKHKIALRAEQALGTKVVIDSLELSLKHNGILIEGFKVANPAGFKDGDTVDCGKILLQPEWNTIFSKVPTIRNISLENLKINLRHELGNGTNTTLLAKGISAYMENLDATNKGIVPAQIKVKKVAINSGKLSVDAALLPVPPITLDLNPFVIDNINEGQPLPFAKLIGVLLRDVLLEAVTLNGVLSPLKSLLKQDAELL